MPAVKKKSAYSQMYLVTPGVYEKLLKCLDEGDKRVLDDFNNPPHEDVRESEREIQGLGAMDVYQTRPGSGFSPGFSQRFEPGSSSMYPFEPGHSTTHSYTGSTREFQPPTEQDFEPRESSISTSVRSGPSVIYGEPTSTEGDPSVEGGPSTSMQVAISEDTPLAQLRKIKKSRSLITKEGLKSILKTKKPIARIMVPDFLRSDNPGGLLYSEPMSGIEYDRPIIQEVASASAPLSIEYIPQNKPTQIELSQIRRQMESKPASPSLQKVKKGRVLKKSGLIEEAPIRRLGGQIKFVPSKMIVPNRPKCTDKGSGQMCTIYDMPTSQKVYACDVCDKQFKRRSYLMQHIEKHHSTNEPHVSYPDDERLVDLGEYVEPYPIDPAEIEGGMLAIEGTPPIAGSSRLAIEGRPALKFQSWKQQKKPRKLKVTKRLAIEGPLAIESTSATSRPRKLKGSRRLAVEGTRAIEGTQAIEGPPAIEGPLAIEGTSALESTSKPAIEFQSWGEPKSSQTRKGRLIPRPDVSFQSWAIGRSRLGKKRTVTKTKFPDPFKINRPTKVPHQD